MSDMLVCTEKEKLTVYVIDVVDTNLRVEPGFPSPWQLIANTVSERQGLGQPGTDQNKGTGDSFHPTARVEVQHHLRAKRPGCVSVLFFTVSATVFEIIKEKKKNNRGLKCRDEYPKK